MPGQSCGGKNNWKLTFYSTSRRQREYVCVTTESGTSLLKPQRLPCDTPPPKRQHQLLPNSCVNWGPSIQIYEPMGPFSFKPPQYNHYKIFLNGGWAIAPLVKGLPYKYEDVSLDCPHKKLMQQLSSIASVGGSHWRSQANNLDKRQALQWKMLS